MKEETPLVAPVAQPLRKERVLSAPTLERDTEVEEFYRRLQMPARKNRDRTSPSAMEARRARWLEREELINRRLRQAALAVRGCVEIDPKKLGGVPTLKGVRFSVGQVLSQLADGDSIGDLAENFDLDIHDVATLLHALAAYIDRPLQR
jgi:uncharacterized protein (DUF433 family)